MVKMLPHKYLVDGVTPSADQANRGDCWLFAITGARCPPAPAGQRTIHPNPDPSPIPSPDPNPDPSDNIPVTTHPAAAPARAHLHAYTSMHTPPCTRLHAHTSVHTFRHTSIAAAPARARARADPEQPAQVRRGWVHATCPQMPLQQVPDAFSSRSRRPAGGLAPPLPRACTHLHAQLHAHFHRRRRSLSPTARRSRARRPAGGLLPPVGREAGLDGRKGLPPALAAGTGDTTTLQYYYKTIRL